MPAAQSIASLTPFEIWEVMLDNRIIKFFEKLVLTPRPMPHDPEEPGDVDYVEVEEPTLAISAYGTTIEELESAVRSDIRFAWKHYVLADDSHLTSDAIAVKKKYLELSEVVE
jgi:hypothetical protein